LPFERFAGAITLRERTRFRFVLCRQIAAVRRVLSQQVLGATSSQRRASQNLPDAFFNLETELFGQEDVIDESDSQSLLGQYQLAGQDQPPFAVATPRS